MKYISKPVEIEAMKWTVPDNPEVPIDLVTRAHDIVAWVNTNGGEARYEPADDHIAVRTINGWAYAAPGHYVVMGSETFLGTNGPDPDGPAWRVRDFYPCDPETFEKRWESQS